MIQKDQSIQLPTKFGNFVLHSYINESKEIFLAIAKGNVSKENVSVRIHSSCVTSDIFGSLRCECGPQLEHALSFIEKKGEGVVIYLFQEGRGIGLVNKLRAYKLQEEGMDTAQANIALGFPIDSRSYEVVPHILNDLGVLSIELMTNNPKKLEQLKSLNINITKRLPIIVGHCDNNEKYLLTKKEKLGHML